LRTNRRELTGQIFISPIDVVRICNNGFSFGRQPGDDQSRASPDVVGTYRGPRKSLDAAHDSMSTLSPDLSAHPY
jgi:hypothetical protein